MTQIYEHQNQVKEEEKNQEILKKKIQIEKLIYIIIDLKKTSLKINQPLNKNSFYEKYYLINLDWYNEYLKNSQMNTLFSNNKLYSKIHMAVNKDLNLSNKDLLGTLLKEREVNKEINNICNILVHNNLPNKFSLDPQVGKNKLFNYYYNFTLISYETIKKLFTFDQKIPSLNCLLGDNKIFLIFNNNIIMYEIKENKYIPKLIFYFYDKGNLSETIELLKEIHLEEYKKYYMLFNEDCASPIFNKTNNEIGYAFLYNPNIQDYSNYMINDDLKTLIKLYFNYAKFRKSNNEQRNGKYFLINPELISEYKKYYGYQNLEAKLNGNSVAQQIIDKGI